MAILSDYVWYANCYMFPVRRDSRQDASSRRGEAGVYRIMATMRMPQGRHRRGARYWRTLRQDCDIPTERPVRPCRRAAKRKRLTGKDWFQPSRKERELLGITSRLELTAPKTE